MVTGKSSPAMPAPPSASGRPLDHQLLDLRDGLGRVEAFGANLRAVHDGVAAIEFERVLEIIEAFAGRFIAAVDDPAIGLKQGGGPEEFVAVPPIARAGGRARGAHDALVKPVEFLAVGFRLLPL